MYFSGSVTQLSALIHLLILALYNFFVYLISFLSFLSFLYLFTSILIYFLTYLLPDLSTPLRIDPFRFQAGGRRRRLILASVFFVFIIYICGMTLNFLIAHQNRKIKKILMRCYLNSAVVVLVLVCLSVDPNTIF